MVNDVLVRIGRLVGYRIVDVHSKRMSPSVDHARRELLALLGGRTVDVHAQIDEALSRPVSLAVCVKVLVALGLHTFLGGGVVGGASINS